MVGRDLTAHHHRHTGISPPSELPTTQPASCHPLPFVPSCPLLILSYFVPLYLFSSYHNLCILSHRIIPCPFVPFSHLVIASPIVSCRTLFHCILTRLAEACPIVLYLIVWYPVPLYPISSYHTLSYYILSHRIIPCLIVSFLLSWYLVPLYSFSSYHTLSYCIHSFLILSYLVPFHSRLIIPGPVVFFSFSSCCIVPFLPFHRILPKALLRIQTILIQIRFRLDPNQIKSK